MVKVIRKVVFILSACLIISGNLNAQPNSFQKRYGSTLQEYALQMISCDNGDIFALAWRSNQRKILAFRLDYLGNIIWERSLQDSATFRLLPVRCIETFDHGFCIFANPQYSGPTSIPSSSALIKLDSQGQLLWVTEVAAHNKIFDGSDITEAPNGCLYVSGDLLPYPDPTSGPQPYIAKFNSSGQFLWCRSSTSNYYPNTKRLITNSDTIIYLAINGFGIIKLDSAGNTINCILYRDSARTLLNFNDWLIDSTGYIKTVLFTHSTSQSVTLCHLNQQGNPTSALNADKGGHTLKGIQLLSVDTGYISLMESSGSSKVIVSDWSSGNSNPNGIKVGTNNPFYPVSFARKPDGSLFIYGSLSSTTNFHLLKTDITTSGILPLSGCNTDTTFLSISPITIYDSVINFTLSPLTLFPHPSYLTDSSIVLSQSTDCMITGINSSSTRKETLSVFPNPANDFVTIQLDMLAAQNVEIKIINVLGQTIIDNKESVNPGKFEKRIDLTELSDGIYLIVMNVGEQEFSRKIIVQ